MALTLPEAEQHVQRCRDQLQQDPDNKELQNDLAGALCNELAPLLAKAERKAEAESAAREGIGITRRLLEADPGEPRTRGFAYRITEAAAYLPTAEAVTETAAAVTVFRRLAAQDPAERGWLANALAGRLAPRQWAAGQRDAAAASTREGLEIIKVLADEPEVSWDHLRSYASFHWRVAIYLPTEEMLAATEYAVRLYRRVAHPDPINEHNRKDLASGLDVWAKRLAQLGRHDEAAVVRRDADRAARYGEHSLFGQDYRFPELAPIAAIARRLDQIDVFAVGSDGGVYTQWWNERWQDYARLGTMTFQPGTQVAVAARNADQMDLFAVAWDGQVRTAYWNGTWNTEWKPVGDKTFPQLTPVAALSRDSDFLDVFAVGEDGTMYLNWWSGDWHVWSTLPGRSFPPRAHVAALARDSDHMDIWAVGQDRGVYWASWNGDWGPWTRIGTKEFPPGSHIAAVSRTTNAMEVWLVDESGRVHGNWFDDGTWHDWYPLGDMAFPAGTPLSAIHRGSDFMEVYGVGPDNQVHFAWFDGSTWRSWFPVGSPEQEPKATFPLRTPVAAFNRSALPIADAHVTDLFAVHADAGIHSVYNVKDNWQQHSWFRIPVAVVRFQQPIESGGIAALGGWAGVTICIDGSVQWYVHAHDSGADSYDFGVAFFVRTANDQALALFHNGDVSAGHRTEFYEEITPPNDVVLGFLSDFAVGQDSMNMAYESQFGSTLEGAVSFAAKWFVGATPVGAVVGAIVFVGLEIYSVIDTGSLEEGAVYAAEVLWGAGPSNSLLALAAGGIAQIGHRYRELHDNEWAVATAVFGGQLPPRDKILITDTGGPKGPSGALLPFTTQGLHHNVLLNFGTEGFDDPLAHYTNYANEKYDRPYTRGEVFIHELTHAWQIRHTGFSPGLLAGALASAVAGQSSYDYGPAGPDYGDFSLEGQAQLVSDWFGNHATLDANDKVTGLDSQDAIKDPYYRYIAGNIRIGNY